jgi:hypothetical protein
MSQWRDVAELIASEIEQIEAESGMVAQLAQHPDPGLEHTVDCIAALMAARSPVRLSVGPELFRFSSFSNWVNKAKGWFRGVPAGSWVCIDQRGRICNSGKEFMRADREGAFPVVVYSIDPEATDE